MKVFLFNILFLILGIALIEVIWKFRYSDDIRFSVNVLADTHYRHNVSLYRSSINPVLYNRDKNGFRGEYDQPEEIDIIAVGGSTTDQKFIDDQKEWCRVMERQLNSSGLALSVVNAGVDGQSSFGHIKNFELWFPQIAALKPKYILFYVGVNDFYKESGFSYDDLAGNRSLKGLIKKSFSYYLFRLVKGMILANIHGVDHQKIDFNSVTTTTEPLIDQIKYQPLMSARLQAYSMRLKVLAEKTTAMGATPIFVTQRRMAYWLENGQLVGIAYTDFYDGVEYNSVDLYYMNRLLNQTTLAACHAEKVLCIDLASELLFDHSDFYDYLHNTPAGAEKIGNFLADKIKVIDDELTNTTDSPD